MVMLTIYTFIEFFQLCFDLIEEWIKNNPKASICTPEGLNEFRHIANFQDYHGLPQFRNVSNISLHLCFFRHKVYFSES